MSKRSEKRTISVLAQRAGRAAGAGKIVLKPYPKKGGALTLSEARRIVLKVTAGKA